jgi:uncharacterized protein (TIGR02266 family)
MSKDKRQHPRAPSSEPVRLKSASAGEFAEYTGKNISAGGVFAATPEPFPEGALVRYELTLEGEVVSGVGRVIWKKEGDGSDVGMGIRFVKVNGDGKKVLEAWVEDHIDDEPAAAAEPGPATAEDEPAAAASDEPATTTEPEAEATAAPLEAEATDAAEGEDEAAEGDDERAEAAEGDDERAAAAETPVEEPEEQEADEAADADASKSEDDAEAAVASAGAPKSEEKKGGKRSKKARKKAARAQKAEKSKAEKEQRVAAHEDRKKKTEEKRARATGDQLPKVGKDAPVKESATLTPLLIIAFIAALIIGAVYLMGNRDDGNGRDGDTTQESSE